ncbi:MAG: GGDEF domain-containing protein [Proteobacteria bacterium]|nr:GGDEF domain-containing protein [Pseudomonadota bacterium]HQR05028.1 GGDEF domain-containing protein [Rhodocyclaceae bacterium]
MLDFDNRSLLMSTCLLALIATLLLLGMWRGLRHQVVGLHEWALGSLMLTAAAPLFLMRGWVPDFVSVMLANLLLVAGLLTNYAGLRRFRGRPVPWQGIGLTLALAASLFTWFKLGQNDFRARTIVGAFYFSLVFLASAWEAHRIRPRSFATGFTTASFLFAASISLLRSASLVLGWDDETRELLDPTLVQHLYLLSFSFTVLLFALGFILMSQDRRVAMWREVAAHDMLSGVLNRRALLETLEREIARSRRGTQPLSVLMLDLDHFKIINDTHGHPTGDRVIAEFARQAGATLRQHDYLGRYGGEEFLAILPDTCLEDAVHVAGRLRTALRPGTGIPRYTVSIGVAQWHSGSSGDELVAAADTALYRAKAAGRDRVEFVPLLQMEPVPA